MKWKLAAWKIGNKSKRLKCLYYSPQRTFVFLARVPVQKLPLSTSTRSPVACWASAGSSSLRPYRAGPAASRQSTARYTPPLPPPRQLPPRRHLHPPCLTRWLSPHQATPHRRPRATPRLSTTACSSLRACPFTSAKVSGRTHPQRNRPHFLYINDKFVHFCWLLCNRWISCMCRLSEYLLVCVDVAASALTLLSVRCSFRWSVSGLSPSPDSHWHTR